VAAGVFALALAPPVHAQGACVGDCNGDGEVTIDELLIMVNIALGAAPVTACLNGDVNCDGEITVDEIILSVSNALGDPATCVRTNCNGEGACGDSFVDPGEECDDGGICVGGATAGVACTSDEECGLDQPGICTFGLAFERACLDNGDCAGGVCVRCKTFGGDGCAANCTLETEVPFNLVPGGQIGGSTLTVESEAGPVLSLPLGGSQILTIGKETNGAIPFVVKAASVQLPQIPISTIACACIRGVEAKTCGGTLYDLDGRRSAGCTLQDNCAAAGLPPCSFLYGTGNSAAGLIGCLGLEPVDVSVTQDCNAGPGEPPFDPEIELTGVGPPGSAIVLNTIQIGTQVGACTPNFCTEADPPGTRGTPTTFFSTTGVATGLILNANNVPGAEIGPELETGSEFGCPALIGPSPSASGACLAGVFTACNQPGSGDIVGTVLLCAE
jgi:hypothetical protein